MAIDRWIEHWAGWRAGQAAIVLPETVISYGELLHRVRAAAATLSAHGVSQGSRVAALVADGSVMLETLFGCARLGAVLVPLNTRLTQSELTFMLDDAEPTALISDTTHAATAARLVESSGPPVLPVILDPVVGFADHDTRRSDDPPRASPESPLSIIYTSGTTGRPKGAILTQASYEANAANVAAMMDLTGSDRGLNVMPQFHVGGLNVHATPTLRAGGVLLQHRHFDPDAVLEQLMSEATLGTLVPTMLRSVVEREAWDSARFRNLRALNSGSSHVPRHLIDAVHAKGVPVTQVYGLTETGPLVFGLRAEKASERAGSCGRPGLNVEVRLADGLDEPRQDTAVGEVVVRGPSVTAGYWRNPSATNEAFLPGGWFRTGDIARVEDGFFYIEDRVKNVIISGGENIYAAELEAVLDGVRGVAEAAVVPMKDETWGEAPLVVAVREPHSSVSDADILGAFDGIVASYKHPKAVRWVNALPRTAMGKIQRHLLHP